MARGNHENFNGSVIGDLEVQDSVARCVPSRGFWIFILHLRRQTLEWRCAGVISVCVCVDRTQTGAVSVVAYAECPPLLKPISRCGVPCRDVLEADRDGRCGDDHRDLLAGQRPTFVAGATTVACNAADASPARDSVHRQRHRQDGLALPAFWFGTAYRASFTRPLLLIARPSLSRETVTLRHDNIPRRTSSDQRSIAARVRRQAPRGFEAEIYSPAIGLLSTAQ